MKRLPAALPSFLVASVLCGCFSLQPTYTKEKAAEAVIALCRNEYGLKINAWLSGDTLYVYLPVASLTTTDKELAGVIQKNINRLVVSATRVCLSMNPRVEFLVIAVTDTGQHGIEYRIVNYVTDLVKLQCNAISRNDFAARSIISITQNPLGVGDEEGKYILKEPVRKEDFVCSLIAQKISYSAAQQHPNAAAGPPKAAEVSLKNRYLEINLLQPASGTAAGLKETALAAAAWVINEYDFRDFDTLKLYGPPPDNAGSEFNRQALLSHPQEVNRK